MLALLELVARGVIAGEGGADTGCDTSGNARGRSWLTRSRCRVWHELAADVSLATGWARAAVQQTNRADAQRRGMVCGMK